jgi:hypothetical protein
MANIELTARGDYRISELFARCEDKLSLLYRIYAGRFPAHRNFWIALSEREAEYARSLRMLREDVKSGKITINDDAFGIISLVAFYKYLSDEIRRAETGQLTPAIAVSIAMTMEQTVYKAKHLKYFADESPDSRETLHRLDEENRSFREIIWQQWRKSR